MWVNTALTYTEDNVLPYYTKQSQPHHPQLFPVFLLTNPSQVCHFCIFFKRLRWPHLAPQRNTKALKSLAFLLYQIIFLGRASISKTRFVSSKRQLEVYYPSLFHPGWLQWGRVCRMRRGKRRFQLFFCILWFWILIQFCVLRCLLNIIAQALSQAMKVKVLISHVQLSAIL